MPPLLALLLLPFALLSLLPLLQMLPMSMVPLLALAWLLVTLAGLLPHDLVLAIITGSLALSLILGCCLLLSPTTPTR